MSDPSMPPAAPRPSGPEWIRQFAEQLGVRPPTDAEFTDLLALAGVAAHASERIAAPVACWLAASAGVNPADARRLAEQLVEQMDEQMDEQTRAHGDKS